MQEHEVTFIHLPGKADVIADALCLRRDLGVNAIQLYKRKQDCTLLELDEEVYKDTPTEALTVEPQADEDTCFPAVSPLQGTTVVLSKSLLDSVTTLQGEFSLKERLWCKRHL
jgi:hypothetical protein